MFAEQDPIGSVRWDKADPYDAIDSLKIDDDIVKELVDSISQDASFIQAIGLDQNITKYGMYKRSGKYNKMKVAQSMMRIINVYRKKNNKKINNLDELKLAAVKMEEIIYASI